MRLHYFIFLLLSTGASLYGQQKQQLLHLNITTVQKTNYPFIESLNPTKQFSERALLDTEIDSLESTIIEKGYIDLQTQILQENDSTVHAIFNFGNLYETIRLSIGTNPVLSDYIKESGFDIRKDSIELETAFAKAYLKQLTTIASNSGNPFGSFTITNITKEKSKLKGRLRLEESQNRNIDKFILKGYKNFPKGYLTHYARLKTGERFNQKKLIKQNDILATLPFATTKKEPEILFKKDSTIAYYYLERTNINRFDGFLGFASNDDSNLRLDGYLDLLLVNNLNYGEQLALNYKSDGNDQSQLKITTKLPYILNTPLGVNAEIALFRKDSTFSTSNLSANLYLTLSPTSTIGVGYNSKNSENLQDQNIASLQEIQDYDSEGYKLFYTYNERQSSFFFPIRTNIRADLGLNQRATSIETSQQIRVALNAERIFYLNKTNSIYIRSKTDYLSSDSYVTNELFRFGGIQSIRGFEENSLFANILSVLNTEYRVKLNPSLYVNSVIDLGYFENDILKQKERLFSAGIGTGIRTQAGVLKINIANGKFENQPFRLANTKLHILLAINF